MPVRKDVSEKEKILYTIWKNNRDIHDRLNRYQICDDEIVSKSPDSNDDDDIIVISSTEQLKRPPVDQLNQMQKILQKPAKSSKIKLKPIIRPRQKKPANEDYSDSDQCNTRFFADAGIEQKQVNPEMVAHCNDSSQEEAFRTYLTALRSRPIPIPPQQRVFFPSLQSAKSTTASTSSKIIQPPSLASKSGQLPTVSGLSTSRIPTPPTEPSEDGVKSDGTKKLNKVLLKPRLSQARPTTSEAPATSESTDENEQTKKVVPPTKKIVKLRKIIKPRLSQARRSTTEETHTAEESSLSESGHPTKLSETDSNDDMDMKWEHVDVARKTPGNSENAAKKSVENIPENSSAPVSRSSTKLHLDKTPLRTPKKENATKSSSVATEKSTPSLLIPNETSAKTPPQNRTGHTATDRIESPKLPQIDTPSVPKSASTRKEVKEESPSEQLPDVETIAEASVRELNKLLRSAGPLLSANSKPLANGSELSTLEITRIDECIESVVRSVLNPSEPTVLTQCTSTQNLNELEWAFEETGKSSPENMPSAMPDAKKNEPQMDNVKQEPEDMFSDEALTIDDKELIRRYEQQSTTSKPQPTTSKKDQQKFPSESAQTNAESANHTIGSKSNDLKDEHVEKPPRKRIKVEASDDEDESSQSQQPIDSTFTNIVEMRNNVGVYDKNTEKRLKKCWMLGREELKLEVELEVLESQITATENQLNALKNQRNEVLSKRDGIRERIQQEKAKIKSKDS